LDKSLDIIVNPVLIPEGGIQILNNADILANVLNEITRLNAELANLLREYLNLINSSASSSPDMASLGERILTIRENIGELLHRLKVFLESLGATVTRSTSLGVDLGNIENIRIPNIQSQIFNFDYLNNEIILGVVRPAFNVLEAEFVFLLDVSYTVSSEYSGIY
jgi:hypothetical protein